MPRPRPRASKAKDRHGELAAFAQERLVVGDVLRCRPVEIETRPHRARQSVGSEIFLLRFRLYGIRPAAPIAIEEAKVKLLTPKYERLWEIELPVQSMMPAVGKHDGHAVARYRHIADIHMAVIPPSTNSNEPVT